MNHHFFEGIKVGREQVKEEMGNHFAIGFDTNGGKLVQCFLDGGNEGQNVIVRARE